MTSYERGKQPADFEAEARVTVSKTGNAGESTDLAGAIPHGAGAGAHSGNGGLRRQQGPEGVVSGPEGVVSGPEGVVSGPEGVVSGPDDDGLYSEVLGGLRVATDPPGYTDPDGEPLPSFMHLATADNFPDFPIILLPGGFAIGQRIATFASTGLVVVMVRTPDTPWGMMTVMLPIAGLSVVDPADVTDEASLSDLGRRVPARFRLVGPVTEQGEHALSTVQGYLPAPFVMLEGDDERMVLVAEALDTLVARREAQGLPINVVLFPD